MKWFRFSLRTLLLLIAVLCVWLGFQVNAARRQKEAVAAILRAGGTISFDFQTVPVKVDPDLLAANPDPTASPNAPAWLRSCLGDDFFRDVVEVNLNGQALSDQEFGRLSDLSELRYLHLTGTTIEVADVANQRPIQDADLAALGHLRQLRCVVLCKADINGPGLAYLANSLHIRDLDLNSSHVDDSAMEHIGRLTTLTTLRIADTQITDAGLAQLENLSRLAFLDLVNTAIADAAMEHIAKLKKLTYLDLRGTNVTDVGLARLARLSSLKSLRLDETRVTREGVHQIQISLPQASISGP